MKDQKLRNHLALLTVVGTAIASVLMLAGLAWYFTGGHGSVPKDHLFHGEPGYLENPVTLALHAFQGDAVKQRRTLTMIGLMLLMIGPPARVAYALAAFATQRNVLYAAVCLFILIVLLAGYF